MGFLFNCHRWLLCFPVAYVVFILSLGIPYIQRGYVYQLNVRSSDRSPRRPTRIIKSFALDCLQRDIPSLAPGQVRNFQLTTPDGAKIGVWHALPEAVYVRHFQQSENSSGSSLQSHTGPIPMSVFESALRSHKTVLYSHGNAASRAQGSRTALLRSFSGSTYGACDEGLNFVIYDYRGFADSSPSSMFPPSEEGLITDARTVWNYIMDSGADPKNISIMGQSLGTGVSTALAHRLITEENVSPNSLCLIAPFTSIPELLTPIDFSQSTVYVSRSQHSLRKAPVLHRLHVVEPTWELLKTAWLLDTLLATHFNTKSLIPSITTNIMLIHAKDDIDVHPSHSKCLFEHIHEHHSTNVTASDMIDLPILLPSSHKQSHLSRTPIHTSSDNRLKPVITTHEIPNFGTLRHLTLEHLQYECPQHEDKSYQSSEKVKVRPIFDYMTDQNNIGEQQKIVPPNDDKPAYANAR
ncbi:hypothetical protein PSHT_02356 [Puccinia striiformis]|uniref:Serine aminopeptidase S33 domain-containing protein n=1 Tax=Puccinia striiformis TaxID=27350 RepID=A0A2S4WIB8_9BASI|nr:hypothetical protein PSHT_02356 [Puccinia striiformis]